MNKLLASILTLFSSNVLACSEAHDYVETSRTRTTADVTSVFTLSGKYSHLANVSARLSNGHAIILTVPGETVTPGKRLIVEEVVLKDSLKNGDPAVKYDFVRLFAD